MRSLRECNKMIKIKNMYNITMVYKSRKNKRRKSSRKSLRRMYGGVSPPSSVPEQQFSNTAQNKKQDDIAGDRIMKKIEEQNKVEFPSIDDIPIIGPVIEKTGDLIEGASVNLIDKTGDFIGVDIDNPGSVSQKLDDVKEIVSNPENIEKMKEIAGEIGKYGEVAVVAFKPAAEKFIDTSLPVVTEGIDKAVKAGVATGVNLVEDVAGPFIGIPRTLLSAATAFNASVNAGSELIKGTAEAIQGTQENMNRLLDKIPKVPDMSKIPNMPKVPDMSRVPDMSKVPDMSRVPNMSQITLQSGGMLLEKYKKDAKIIGGRLKESQSTFLDSNINSRKILQQYGGKMHTRSRRSLRKKMILRKR